MVALRLLLCTATADGPKRRNSLSGRQQVVGSAAPTTDPVTETKHARPQHIKRAGDDYGLVKSPKTFIHASYEGRRLKPIMIRAATQKPECMTRKPSSADEN